MFLKCKGVTDDKIKCVTDIGKAGNFNVYFSLARIGVKLNDSRKLDKRWYHTFMKIIAKNNHLAEKMFGECHVTLTDKKKNKLLQA